MDAIDQQGYDNMIPTLRIISGGQCGADQGALCAAKKHGIPTDGWAPKGYITEYGPAPWLADYGIREAPEPDYPSRTRRNVAEAVACIWFGNPHSPGGRLTLRLCAEAGISVFVVMEQSTPADVVKWLTDYVFPGRDAVTLMVAGNRESKTPGIAEMVDFFSERSIQTGQGHHMTEQEWMTCQQPDTMLVHLGREFLCDYRKLRLWMLPIWERIANSAISGRKRLLQAIAQLCRMAEGNPESNDTHCSTWEDAYAAARQTCACIDGENDHRYAADLLREIIGNPFRPVARWKDVERHDRVTVEVFADDYLTPTVLAVARSVYDGAWDEIGILRDALLDADCECEPVLRHLAGETPCPVYETVPTGNRCPQCGKNGHWRRGVHFDHQKRCCLVWEPGEPAVITCRTCNGTGWCKMTTPHVRGCWAVDLILGLT